MHMRGKAFRYEVEYPDGRSEVLLDVPEYDFNWQSSFVLSKPKLIPKGSVMKCTAWYNNSKSNLANPNPEIAVRWGEQTWQEMMIGWHDVAVELRPKGDEQVGVSTTPPATERTVPQAVADQIVADE